MRFYLGTHRPNWLADPRVNVPLFVSRRTLGPYKTLPRALTNWALDSGGFTELNMHGTWQTTAKEYIADVRRFVAEVGNLDYAAPQDWMCEPVVLAATGKTIREHQELTIRNYLELLDSAPELPWLPVLQGWSQGDYLRCLEGYGRAGIDLTTRPVVGIGTVCRRQDTAEAAAIVERLADEGVALHGFGFKLTGLRAVGHRMAAADSMAWSYSARKNPRLPGCAHKNCANCWRYALRWRDKVLAVTPTTRSRT